MDNNYKNLVKIIDKTTELKRKLFCHFEYIKQTNTKGTNGEKYVKIVEYVSDKFVSARFDGLAVRNQHLRMWAFEKATMVDLPIFKVSPLWVYLFKQQFEILQTNYKINVPEIPYQYGRIVEKIDKVFEAMEKKYTQNLLHLKFGMWMKVV